jgi:hypothetical protein
MSAEWDEFSVELLEEAKRFLELAQSAQTPAPMLHASLLLAFSALESHINGVADELLFRPDIGLLDHAVLSERSTRLKHGEWVLGNEQSFLRLEDRLSFVFRRFGSVLVNEQRWWSDLLEAVRIRNRLVHPRESVTLDQANVRRYVQAVVDALNSLYLAIFKKGHPAYSRGLQSQLTFG